MAEKIKLFNVEDGKPKEVRTFPELLQMLGSGQWSVDPPPAPAPQPETKPDAK